MVTLNMEHIVAVLKRRRIEPAQYPSPPPPLCGPTYYNFSVITSELGQPCQAVELPVFYHAIQQTHPPPNPVGRVDPLYGSPSRSGRRGTVYMSSTFL